MHWHFAFNRCRIGAPLLPSLQQCDECYTECCFADLYPPLACHKSSCKLALWLASVYMPLANKCGAAAKVLALEPQAASRTVGRCARLLPDAARSAAIGKTHLCGSVISESSTTLERIQIEIRS